MVIFCPFNQCGHFETFRNPRHSTSTATTTTTTTQYTIKILHVALTVKLLNSLGRGFAKLRLV